MISFLFRSLFYYFLSRHKTDTASTIRFFQNFYETEIKNLLKQLIELKFEIKRMKNKISITQFDIHDKDTTNA